MTIRDAFLPAVLLATFLAGCSPAGITAPGGAKAATAAERESYARARQLWERAEALRAENRAASVQLYMLGEAEAGGSDAPKLDARRRALEGQVARRRAEAITVYRAICDAPDLRGAPERPAALFALARAMHDAGDIDEAKARYRQLAEEHPGAPETPEAQLALANLAFADGDAEEAAWRCEGALRHDAPPALRKRALYLKSWSLRGRGRTDARAAMEALREIVRTRGARPGTLEAEIEAAAARELVSLYTTHGDPDEAPAFFKGAGDAGPELLAAARARGLGTGRRLERLDRRIY